MSILGVSYEPKIKELNPNINIHIEHGSTGIKP